MFEIHLDQDSSSTLNIVLPSISPDTPSPQGLDQASFHLLIHMFHGNLSEWDTHRFYGTMAILVDDLADYLDRPVDMSLLSVATHGADEGREIV